MTSNKDCLDIDRDSVQRAVNLLSEGKKLSAQNTIFVMAVLRRTEQQAQMLAAHLHQGIFRLAMLGELEEVKDFFEEYAGAKADFAHAMDIFGEVFGQQPLTSDHMATLLVQRYKYPQQAEKPTAVGP